MSQSEVQLVSWSRECTLAEPMRTALCGKCAVKQPFIPAMRGTGVLHAVCIDFH